MESAATIFMAGATGFPGRKIVETVLIQPVRVETYLRISLPES